LDYIKTLKLSIFLEKIIDEHGSSSTDRLHLYRASCFGFSSKLQPTEFDYANLQMTQ